MSEVKSAPHIISTKLPDGVFVRVNDHVYLAPEHLGEPYYVGRIMEFCSSHKRKGLQARIAWFNRPKDVLNKKSADPCLLVATMHSDINPVSSIRGKCVVTHKYYIAQLEEYRKKQDHFYYTQLYDRYIQRVYDVVPCEIVQNVPMDTLEALKLRYQFIVVEQGKATDLTVARRICFVCQDWCSSTVSVKCAACQKSYHMTCLNPPLPRKPSKGFAWQCAFCAPQEMLTPASPMSNQKTDKNDAKKRQPRTTRSQISKVQPRLVQPKPSTSQPLSLKLKVKKTKKKTRSSETKMTNMWPFRYFGVNTNMGDILDIDDRIYPRAKSRIGPKYQANVPDYDTTKQLSLSPVSEFYSLNGNKSKTRKTEKKGKSSQRVGNKRSGESTDNSSTDVHFEHINWSLLVPNRGGDDTATCIYRPNLISDEQANNYMNNVQKLKNISLPSYSSDLMDQALLQLDQKQYKTEDAYTSMSRLMSQSFEHAVDWSKQEVDAFEQSIREHGHDLNYAKKSVQTKSMPDIVRYFYQWKKTDRYEPVYSEWTKIFKPTKTFKSLTQKKTLYQFVKDEVENDEESDPTIIPKATYKKHTYHCMNCLTLQSTIWRRSPSDIDRKRKVFDRVLCNDCGIYWLKYAITKPISEPVRRSHAQILTSVLQHTRTTTPPKGDSPEVHKRKRSESGSKIILKKLKEDKEEILPKVEHTECRVCLQFGLEDKLYTCNNCGMSVHSDCYGIEKVSKESWLCDPCSNKVNPVASYVYKCILCCKSSEETSQPLKRTTGYYWAHIQCAAFIPEIKFVHPKSLSPIEYIGCISNNRLESGCQLCYSHRGACVACTECKKTIHVQCAIEHKFKLAFEIQSPTTTEEEGNTIIPAGLFHPSSPSGFMVPQVWCPNHDITSHRLIDLTTRTSITQESSMMVYIKNYKLIGKGTTPAMRRFRQATYHPYLYNHHHSEQHHHHPKAHNTREDSLETLAVDEIPSLKPHVFLNKSYKHSKQICAIEGCSVQHTPVWWKLKERSEKRICNKCHIKGM